ncbi:lytic transglycosylase domain-containing protein [Haloechinothrix halophila]|uniref:lytic transglycosylase domain-containing protein n=1 Tax=Haloechinothrix halophila TaxID=1069073 RepID=UPI00041A5A75|nr:lytic transglycosylase domain-containing protein [Haloechinothrix halophila]
MTATPPTAVPTGERGATTENPTGVAPPAQLPDTTTPRALATLLTRAERALANKATPDKHRTGWARIQQQAYRELADRPRWRSAARDHVPRRFRAAYDLTLRAATALGQLNSPRAGPPDDWRIRRPLPVAKLRGHYRAAQKQFGVPWQILAAINFVETRFGRIHGDSHAGAQGPMQFMPKTWDAYGKGDVTNPRDAILAAARYLSASGAPADMRGALYAYNHSDHYVDAILAYADAMRRYPHYLDVYHRWQVYFRTPKGDVLLKEGYGS